MNKYITFREEDKEGQLQYYILQRDFPNYVGVISEFPNLETLECVPIPGYSLYVQFSGTIRGNYVPSNSNISRELGLVFNDMASWYYSERILKNEKKYSKFKIKSNG